MSLLSAHGLLRPDGTPFQRYAVVGTSGTGKTTTARALAERLECRHVELDALHWLADWTPRPHPEFRQVVGEALAAERWVVDGNYSAVQDLVLARAQAVLWLDLPFATVMQRITGRTLRRALLRDELWNGNRESWRMALSRESMVLWSAKTWYRRRHGYPRVFSRSECDHLVITRARSAGEVTRLLDALR